jgi:hypothetical protein
LCEKVKTVREKLPRKKVTPAMGKNGIYNVAFNNSSENVVNEMTCKVIRSTHRGTTLCGFVISNLTRKNPPAEAQIEMQSRFGSSKVTNHGAIKIALASIPDPRESLGDLWRKNDL